MGLATLRPPPRSFRLIDSLWVLLPQARPDFLQINGIPMGLVAPTPSPPTFRSMDSLWDWLPHSFPHFIKPKRFLMDFLWFWATHTFPIDLSIKVSLCRVCLHKCVLRSQIMSCSAAKQQANIERISRTVKYFCILMFYYLDFCVAIMLP